MEIMQTALEHLPDFFLAGTGAKQELVLRAFQLSRNTGVDVQPALSRVLRIASVAR